MLLSNFKPIENIVWRRPPVHQSYKYWLTSNKLSISEEEEVVKVWR